MHTLQHNKKKQFNSIQSAAAKLLQGLQLSVCGSIKTNYFWHRCLYVQSLIRILVSKYTFKPNKNKSLSASEWQKPQSECINWLRAHANETKKCPLIVHSLPDVKKCPCCRPTHINRQCTDLHTVMPVN